jgi:hypothetical protein
MAIILTVLALTVIITLVALLALVRTGIRRQERAGCLACQPRGLSTTLARHLGGLYVRQPPTGACPSARAKDESSLVPDKNESPAS